jgi:hypothetical protein
MANLCCETLDIVLWDTGGLDLEENSQRKALMRMDGGTWDG